MTVLTKIDDTLIAGCQWVVDTTGKTGRWCSRQCLYSLIIFAVMYMYFTSFSALLAIMLLICFIIMHFINLWFNTNKYTTTGGRAISLTITCVNLTRFLYSDSETIALVLLSAQDFSIVGFWFFLACDPPRPRRRTSSKLAPSGAA